MKIAISIVLWSILVLNSLAQSGTTLSDITNCHFKEKYPYTRYGMGIGGRLPPIKLYMENSLKEKNYSSLNCWLRSNNIHVMAYGLEGLYRAALDGYQLSDNDYHIMDSLINTPIIFGEMSGCMGVNITYDKIVSKKDLKQIKKPNFLANKRRIKKELEKRSPFAW